MPRWKALFSEENLLAGEKLADAACVRELQFLSNGLELNAVVLEPGDGSRQKVTLRQRLQIAGAPVVLGRCSCAPMDRDARCRHVAATFVCVMDTTSASLQMKLAMAPGLGLPPSITRPSFTTPHEREVHGTRGPKLQLRYIFYQERRFSDLVLVEVEAAVVSGDSNARFRPFNPARPAPEFRFFKTSDEDARVLSVLREASGRGPTGSGYRIFREEGAMAFGRLVGTGRLHAQKGTNPAVTMGPQRQLTLGWEAVESGSMQVAPVLNRLSGDADDADFYILPLNFGWYHERTKSVCGPIVSDYPAYILMELLALGPIKPTAIEGTLQRLKARHPGAIIPAPPNFEIRLVTDIAPVPMLRLSSRTKAVQMPQWKIGRAEPGKARTQTVSVHTARLVFKYGEHRVDPQVGADSIELVDGLKITRVVRNREAEGALFLALEEAGLAEVRHLPWGSYFPGLRHDFGFPADTQEAKWLDFVLEVAPRLRREGWQIELADDFQFDFVAGTNWETQAVPDAAKPDWFRLELGVEVEGKRVDLLPLLMDACRRYPDLFSPRALADAPDEKIVPLRLPDGRLLPMTAGRLRGLASVIVELHGGAERGLRLPAWRAAQVATLADRDQTWRGPKSLLQLGESLRQSHDQLPPIATPASLGATLRPYQQEGLAWLQFLRAHRLAGVLADDMGLGKTVQTLAHLLVEKESGRQDRPNLIVAPTSLVVNWSSEARRFAPTLRVGIWHGSDRASRFPRAAEYDLIITTYPLLDRDFEQWGETEFHCVILDEAHVVKNARAKASLAVRRLRARHRLCLTGTPMENHLGELWSLFDFLLPGLLGEDADFRKLFRTPIEKLNMTERSDALSRRIAPFLLRRKKEEVARDLPPKTEILREVELTPAQRDLYETIRLAMHERVQDEVARNGMAKSQIVILDALLKLRQVCCDPRLVKLAAARGAGKSSAKLDLLLELLTELLEEGRRVLIFSQFTSMLALIEEELKARAIKYVQLTGDTQDRAKPVNAFQAGEVPIFLLSLKAGGTGLNLTAADTVIHYDPWWNPASEQQATDRAHRIGQTQPVFVYRLRTVGTVEEKIAAMQEKKRALAGQVLEAGEGQSAGEKFALSEDDLKALFAPLPAAGPG